MEDEKTSTANIGQAIRTPKAMKEASVTSALDIQDQRTEELIKNLRQLQSRLNPVMRPLVANEIADGVDGEPTPLPQRIYSRISDNTSRVSLANSMIAELLDRVEL